MIASEPGSTGALLAVPSPDRAGREERRRRHGTADPRCSSLCDVIAEGEGCHQPCHHAHSDYNTPQVAHDVQDPDSRAVGWLHLLHDDVMISALSGLSISCQVLRFALAFTGLQLNDARMKLSRTDEFFARALILRALAQEQGTVSDAAEESASASYRQKARRLSRSGLLAASNLETPIRVEDWNGQLNANV